MAIDAQIPLASVAPPSPLNTFQQVGNLQTQQSNLKSAGLAQASDQLKLDSENQNATDQMHTRAAFAAATDPTTGQVNRPVLLSTLGKLDPYLAGRTASALTAQDQAAKEAQIKLQDSQVGLQKVQLDHAEAVNTALDKALQSVNSQATLTNAMQIAQGLGLDPKQYGLTGVWSPQEQERVGQIHQSVLSTQQVIAQQQKDREDAQTAQNNAAQRQQAATNEIETARHNKAEEGVSYANIALKKQELATSKGDPNLAAQLLVNGDATLSELKARGSTPEFIAKTLDAARQLSGGKYNAQAADAQFSVAKSPTNVGFFGSARSLTDKGGTLDQLEQVAKDIPGHQLPVFNSLADAEKAATGSGPIAKYASLMIGVSDDYSKVMGGGQGSDSSRAQALNLVPANASPEARAAAIEGIRGAVGSQINSRIGNNKILGRMYGDGGGDPSTGMVTVQIPGMAPGQIPAAAVAKFQADHPNAKVGQ